jgi:hypothetical protein
MTIAGRNRIKNASFETALLVSGEWKLSEALTAPDSVTRMIGYPYDGSYSVQLNDTGAGGDVGIEIDYTVSAGRSEQRWVASAYLLGLSGDTSVTLLVEFDDTTVLSRYINDVTSGLWCRRYMTFDFPVGATKITRFQILKGDVAPGTSPGTTMVDGVQLEEGSTPSTFYPAAAERTAGQMVIEDYQYEFNGFLFGHDTEFSVQKVAGLLGMPSTSASDIDLVGDHGVVGGVARMTKKVIDIDIALLGSAGVDIEDKLAWAATCFKVARLRSQTASREVKAFVFQRPGQPKKLCWARCDRRDFDSSYDTTVGKAVGALQLVAPDPVMYSYEEHESSATALSGILTTSMTVNNAGDHPDGVRPVVRISGPAHNPRIKNEADDDRTLRLDLDIETNETLVIDLYTRDVRIEETIDPTNYTDAFDGVRNDNEWWNLLPGDNVITYTRDAASRTATSTTITVVHRDGWS